MVYENLTTRNKVFRAQSHRPTWTWQLPAALISLMICKSDIGLNLCCTAASTGKNKAKVSSVAGQELWSGVGSGLLTKSCPPPALGIGEYWRREEERWKRKGRGHLLFLLVPQSILFLSFHPCFSLNLRPNSSALQLLCLLVQLCPEAPWRGRDKPSLSNGSAVRVNDGTARHQHEGLSSFNSWRK